MMMTTGVLSKSKSRAVKIPVPRLIVYRFFRLTDESDYLPSFSWLPFTGASKYIVKLESSQGIIWLKATDKTTVTYDGATLLQPGKDYLLTVEIDRQKSYLDFPIESKERIAQYVTEGMNKIQQTMLPKQLKASLTAQLDGLLIARNEILETIGKATSQGSKSEIIGFLNNFLDRASGFELLANALDCDDILDAFSEIASQLAAANLVLGEYLQLSGVQKSLSKNLLANSIELSLFSQKLERAFQLGQTLSVRASGNCYSECQNLPLWKRCGSNYSDFCGGCPECDPSNT
ncbi:MAG: hypothetical protein AB4368_25565 [Xenococcaceae cyanobacterium]